MNHDNGLSKAIVVNLTLLNILPEIISDDCKASKLIQLVIKDVLSETIPAEKLLAGEPATAEDTKFIQHQVLRYLQPKDKYAALVSTLLKSRAFHLKHGKHGDLQERIVVDLPRTQYKKPYIPLPKQAELSDQKSSVAEYDMFPISISHQHPFVGIANLIETINCGTGKPTLLGMDIVVYDEFNKSLYSNEDDFLEVFQDYFTGREWSLIQSQSSGRLQEFYIRWSMKEAYTKAIGVGLGANFASLDLALQGDLECKYGQCCGVFSSMAQSGDKIYFQRGTVEYLNEDKDKECWDFAFLPLLGDPPLSTSLGCACICVGPLYSTPSTLDSKSNLQLCVDWTHLASLIAWHQGSI